MNHIDPLIIFYPLLFFYHCILLVFYLMNPLGQLILIYFTSMIFDESPWPAYFVFPFLFYLFYSTRIWFDESTWPAYFILFILFSIILRIILF
jgi:hypothetical protein